MGKLIKKYLTLDDLLSFCMQSKMDSFSAKDADGPIIVQSFGEIKTEDTTTMGLTPCTLMACHTELNKNKSFIEESVMNNALASFSNRPILGYIHQLEDGTWNFWDHRVSIETEDDHEPRIQYLETPIGVVPESCNAHLEYDEKHNKNYVVVNGYIYDDYGNRAIEIIRENGGSVDVSVELAINSMSYNAKENYLNIEDFTFMGVTCLGKTPEGTVVNPGMEGSNLKLDNFSIKQNSMFSDDYQIKMIEVLEKLNNTLSNFNTNIQKGGNIKMNTFEVLLAKYGKTAEDITFEIDGLSDEELEAKFAEVFEDIDNTDTSDDNEGVDNTDVFDDNKGMDDGSDGDDSANAEGETDDGSSTPTEEKFTKTFSIELSHEDVRYALYNLISAYDEEDNDWYSIRSVYDSYFYMYGWKNNKLYKVGYSVDGENVALEGERQEMFEIIVSESEKLAIDKMRENYTTLEERYNELVKFKADTEAAQLQAQKDAIFANEEFESVLETKAFKKLVENSKDYTLDECREKAKDILEDFNSFASNFAAHNETQKSKTLGLNFNAKPSKKKTAYGGLFDEDE